MRPAMLASSHVHYLDLCDLAGVNVMAPLLTPLPGKVLPLGVLDRVSGATLLGTCALPL